jgi:hypothetical protein
VDTNQNVFPADALPKASQLLKAPLQVRLFRNLLLPTINASVRACDARSSFKLLRLLGQNLVHVDDWFFGNTNQPFSLSTYSLYQFATGIPTTNHALKTNAIPHGGCSRLMTNRCVTHCFGQRSKHNTALQNRIVGL